MLTRKMLFIIITIITMASPCHGIEVYSDNPFYWQHNGQPMLLLGASGDDNLFQWAGAEFGNRLPEHLDSLVAVGGNYVRNTMSSRFHAEGGYHDDFMAYPFLQLPSGKYDLEQWNPDHWERLDTFLAETHNRDIIVQIELWDLFAVLNETAWAKQPWNPDNNVNYEYDNTILRRDAGGIKQPFFNAPTKTAPTDPTLKRYQDRYIQKVLNATLQYDHVLYQIDNESPLAYEISDYWATFIHSAAAVQGKKVYVCDSRRYRKPSPYVTAEFCDWDNPDIHYPIQHPEVYNYCDISQNGGNTGQTHYDNLVWYREQLQAHSPRPINHVKIYSFIWETGVHWTDRRNPDTSHHATRRFWRTIFGGAAAARHHRDKGNSGLGLTPRGQTDIRSMRMLTDAMNIFTMLPDNTILSERMSDEAYALVEAGQQYAVYFTGVGNRSVNIDLSEIQGQGKLQWLDIENSLWRPAQNVNGNSPYTLTAPGKGEWAALISVPGRTAVNEINNAKAVAPANPNASPAAQEVLEYFHSLPQRLDKRVVTGQFFGHGKLADLGHVTEVQRNTGHWVGMVGGDYFGGAAKKTAETFFLAPEFLGDADWSDTNPLFIDYWKKGGLVTLCLHPSNPQSGKSSWIKKNNDTINLTNVLTPGRPGYDAWMHQLDMIAQGLQELEDEGVVVLFRPFHEMNGNWFWWGTMNMPDEFVKLWRHMFDFMTNTKGLDNLLWVYSPGQRGDYLDFYPGDDFVDMVGLDSYGLSIKQLSRKGYKELTSLGKPFGLAEFGRFKALNFDPNPRNDYDYESFIKAIAEFIPLCTYYAVWHQFHGLQYQQNAKECLEHPWSVNRKDIPAFGR
jgi:beta-mannanase